VSRIVDRLEREGLIAREQDRADRRRWHLQLTEDGTRRLSRGKEEIRLAMGAVLEGLSEEDLAALEDGLEVARRQIESRLTLNPEPQAIP
jgi:DNA-binding MarR family transcriptional regulator